VVLQQAYTIRANRAAIAAAEQSSRLYRLLSSTTAAARLLAWLALQDEDDAVGRQLARFQTDLQNIAPLIDGHYLKKEFKMPTGPLYRVILDTLRDARLDGLVSTLEEERALVEKVLAENPREDTHL
jgi:hypothetical protein